MAFALKQSPLIEGRPKALVQINLLEAIIWVCLKIGYIPNYSHLIGIMIINHWV